MSTSLDFILDKCDTHERHARLRELRALVMVYCGLDHIAKGILDRAIISGDDKDCKNALRAIDRLPALTRRRVLASFGALWK